MNYNVLGRKLLIVEDDDALIREFTAYFSRQNTVFAAADVKEAVSVMENNGSFDASCRGEEIIFR